MGGILVGVLAAVRDAHQIQDLIIVVLPVCPVQAQSTLDFFRITSGSRKIGMTGLTGGQSRVGAAEGCDLLILFFGAGETDSDQDQDQNQKIAAFGSSYKNRVHP